MSSNPGSSQGSQRLSLLAHLKPSDLRELFITIHRKNIPEVPNPPPIERGLGDPSLLVVHFRPDCGQKSIFDRPEVIVNKEDEDKVIASIRSPSPAKEERQSSGRSRKCSCSQREHDGYSSSEQRKHKSCQVRRFDQQKSPCSSKERLEKDCFTSEKCSKYQPSYYKRRSRSPEFRQRCRSPSLSYRSRSSTCRSNSCCRSRYRDGSHKSENSHRNRSRSSINSRRRSGRSRSKYDNVDNYRSRSRSYSRQRSNSPHVVEERYRTRSRSPHQRRRGEYTKEDYERSMLRRRSPLKDKNNEQEVKSVGSDFSQKQHVGFHALSYPHYGGEEYWLPPPVPRHQYFPYPGALPGRIPGPHMMFSPMPVHKFTPRFPLHNYRMNHSQNISNLVVPVSTSPASLVSPAGSITDVTSTTDSQRSNI